VNKRYLAPCFGLIWLILSMACTKNPSKIMETSPELIEEHSIEVMLGGNTWSNDKSNDEYHITDDGVVNWKDANTNFTSYIKVNKTGKLKLWINANANGSPSVIQVSIKNTNHQIKVEGNDFKEFYVGEFPIDQAGYVPIVISGISHEKGFFPNLTSLQISGNIINSETSYVVSNENDMFHFGRRGPSLHLLYNTPEDAEIQYFYNEVTVPKGSDVVGTYVMANGFQFGYFGMQVIGPKNRRVLFSVWSPFETDDPTQIPDEQHVKVLKKGQRTQDDDFGNEGAGKKTFMPFNWKTDTTYGFLLKAQPVENGSIYSAYFFDPKQQRWTFIAEMFRPLDAAYLSELYSFLENFEPSQGNISRTAYYGNQWVCDSKGQWMEINHAETDGDITSSKAFRTDYETGVEGNKFFMKNGGFFDNNSVLRKSIMRNSINVAPKIKLNKLPKS
jgi:Domain of unknown function (DUF5077)/Domain of unknown function (DUF3472)